MKYDKQHKQYIIQFRNRKDVNFQALGFGRNCRWPLQLLVFKMALHLTVREVSYKQPTILNTADVY